ncbi:MAG TPA: HAD family phosphatase [Terriglobales bacterium]|nr:HAD family phosphatase [Terriglobales bacterium]
MKSEPSVVVFDLGGVLVDWNPRYLYRKLFNGNEGAMEHFLATVCTPAWNLQQDAGRSFAEACGSLKALHPEKSALIDAWFDRFDEMLAGTIPGSVSLLAELRSEGVPLYALSNWSAETYPWAVKRFDWLQWFRGIMLSGEVKLVKPDPRIFQLLLERFAIDAKSAVYIDDVESNVKAARALGMYGIRFTDAAALRRDLVNLGLLRHDAPTKNRAARAQPESGAGGKG